MRSAEGRQLRQEGRKSEFVADLHQRSRPPNPVLAVLFGDALHVIDIGGRLRQDVVQVVPHADESEVLLKEFAHTRGPE